MGILTAFVISTVICLTVGLAMNEASRRRDARHRARLAMLHALSLHEARSSNMRATLVANPSSSPEMQMRFR